MKIGLIWCEDDLAGIGKDNKMPWTISAEQAHFKRTTENNVVVMGRKTFESIGGPLPNRVNIVMTRNPEFVEGENILVYHNIEEILRDIRYNVFGNRKVWIIGGREIFLEWFKYAEVLFISRLRWKYDCDTYMDMQQIDKDFTLVKTQTRLNYCLNIYVKNSLRLSTKKPAHELSFF